MHDCHTQRAFMEMHFLGQAKRPPLSLARGDVIGNSGRPCRAAFKAPRLWPQPQNAAAREAKHIALGHVGSCRPLVTRGRPKLWTKGTALVLSYTGGGQRWKGFFLNMSRVVFRVGQEERCSGKLQYRLAKLKSKRLEVRTRRKLFSRVEI